MESEGAEVNRMDRRTFIKGLVLATAAGPKAAQGIVAESEIISEELISIRKVQIAPGDTIVFRHPGALGAFAVECIQGCAKEVFGPEIKVIVLEDGMSLDVLTREEAARRSAISGN